jgi:NADH-quinone oxidoreductase subunit L
MRAVPFYAWIPILPIVAFAVLVVIGRRAKTWAHLVSIPLAALSFLLALRAAFLAYAQVPMHVTFPWAPFGADLVRFGLMVDPMAAVMLLVVTFVALLVQIYSIGYMAGEDRYAWYFAVLSLFTAAMLTLVLADGYLMLYMGWEVVGLCSYLLIGFWFEDEQPRLASKKAFIVTRLGDVGLGLGVMAIFAMTGTFAFSRVFEAVPAWTGGAVTMVALLLFTGAMGKSAQFPLHVWLPDAMAGPTPVSALIHAATMVAAGVYLVARSMPIFSASPVALTTVLVVGALTALGAAVTALGAYDIKGVLAYSTISQLGYMMMALGAGGTVAAMFHLGTHAVFKALLFLGSGSVIHATHTQDIREMGGLRKKMPLTFWTFILGSLALAGIPPLSGFFSKDEVLSAISRGPSPLLFRGVYVHQLVLAVGVLVAGLTALYMGRLCFRVFWGSPVRAHESPAVMTGPLVVLAALAVVAGAFGEPLARFLAPGEARLALNPSIWAPTTLLALAAIGAAWWIYRRGGIDTDELKRRFWLPYTVLHNKFYIDEAYSAVIVRPLLAVCDAAAKFDTAVIDGIVNGWAGAVAMVSAGVGFLDEYVLDGLVDSTAAAALAAGRGLRRTQSGPVTSYLTWMLAAIVGLMVWFLVKGV